MHFGATNFQYVADVVQFRLQITNQIGLRYDCIFISLCVLRLFIPYKSHRFKQVFKSCVFAASIKFYVVMAQW